MAIGPPVDERVALDQLLTVIDTSSAEERFNVRPHLVYVEFGPTTDDVSIGIKHTDGDSVTTAMLGFTAPEEWWALGHVTGGWAAPPETWDDDEVERGRFPVRPSSHPDSVRVRISVLMSRTGMVASRFATADGRSSDESPPLGAAVDVLRRAFRLPTPPPTIPTSELLTSLWLSNVLARAERAGHEGRSLTWATVARTHPALELLRAGGHRARADDLTESAAALARVFTWTEVRRHVIDRGWFSHAVSADLGRWMDEGMLSRWLLSSFPPLERLAADACRILPPAVAARLRTTLNQWPRAATA